MSDKKTFVIDLDGTICSQEEHSKYANAKPNMEMIRKINSLYTEGHRIVIYTARGMNSYKGNRALVEDHLLSSTAEWLRNNRVCFDQLVMGKPAGDFYIDDKGMSIDEFLSRDL